MKHTTLLIALLFSAFLSHGQSIVGKWKSIDDNTKKARSVVEIYKKGDLYYGKIVKLFRPAGEDQNPLCEKCEGSKKNQPIIGLEIIEKMKYDKSDNEYHKGDILDPESGNVYDCKIWIDDNGNLKVRGYLMFFYRTQTWLPYKN